MIPSAILDLLDERGEQSLNRVKEGFNSLVREIKLKFDDYASLNNLEVDLLKILESYFLLVVSHSKKFNKTNKTTFIDLCKSIGLKLNKTSISNIDKLKEDNNFKNQVFANNNILKEVIGDEGREVICDLLICLCYIIKDTSNNVLNVIGEIFECFAQLPTQQEECGLTNYEDNSIKTVVYNSDLREENSLEIIEFGYTFGETEHRKNVSVGAIIKNKSKTKIAKCINVNVKLLDNEGFILENFSYQINKIKPDEILGFGTSINYKSYGAVACKVVVNCKSFADYIDALEQDIEATGRYISEEFNGYSNLIKYNVLFKTNVTYVNGNSYLVFRDENYRILGGCSSYVSQTYSEDIALIEFVNYVDIKTSKKEIYFDLSKY